MQRIISVWIGKIGTGVLDRSIRAILELIGNVSAWRRHTDAKTGQPKSFGFADFSSPRSAVLAKTLLNDLQMGDSRLLVKIDEKNQKIIDEWVAESSTELPNASDEKGLLESITAITNELNAGLNIPPLPPSSLSSTSPATVTPSQPSNSSSTPHSGSETTNQDAPPSSSDSASASTSHGHYTTETPAKVDTSGAKKLTAVELRREEERKRDFEKKLEMMEEAREREQRRVEANEKQYRILDRELEASQLERTAGLLKRKKSEEQSQRLRMEDLARENALNWPQQQVDALEQELRERLMSHDFVKARSREREQDELDREEEESELRAEMRRADERHKEQVRLQQEEQAMRLKEEALKRTSQLSEQAQTSKTAHSIPTHHETPNDKKRPADTAIMESTTPKMAKHSETHTSPHHTLTLGTMPSLPQKTSPQTESSQSFGANAPILAAKIPSDSASLFVTPIRWDLAEKHNLLEAKIRPWVTKKIVEYLEFEEPTMIQFICAHIKERKPPKELISQLKNVLDDEAEVFVITLWRMLLLESLKMESTEH